MTNPETLPGAESSVYGNKILDPITLRVLDSKEHQKPEGIVATNIQVIKRWGVVTWYVSMLHVCPRNVPACPSLLFLLTILASHAKRVIEIQGIFDKHL